MLPCVGPSAVGQGIAYGIVGNGLSIIAGEQVTPTKAVAVGVSDSVCRRKVLYTAGSISIFLPVENVTAVVILPDMGKATGLVILPDELIGRVIHITGGIRAIRNA